MTPGFNGDIVVSTALRTTHKHTHYGCKVGKSDISLIQWGKNETTWTKQKTLSGQHKVCKDGVYVSGDKDGKKRGKTR